MVLPVQNSPNRHRRITTLRAEMLKKHRHQQRHLLEQLRQPAHLHRQQRLPLEITIRKVYILVTSSPKKSLV